MQFQPKYPELQDKIWLEQKYTKKQLSSTAISRIVGCHKDSVIVALKRHDIPIRDGKAARKLVPLQSFKYDLLNDGSGLFQKYVIEGLSTQDIAQIAGAKTANSARQALLRFGIPVRGYREGQIYGREEDGFVLNQKTQELIEGGLLGDAHLRIYNKSSRICAPAFQRRNKFHDHVEFVCKQLGCDSSRVKKKREKDLNGDRTRTMHQFVTLTHNCLIPFYRKWYPTANNYKKAVPEDLVLTPTILLHWFLDDGSSSWRNRKYSNKRQKQRKKQVELSFCSESFTKKENMFLRDQMKNLFDIPCSVTPVSSGTGWRIKVLQSGAATFFDLIGPCPVPNLAYKWKIPS